MVKMTSTAKRLEVQVEEKQEFDGHLAKGIRERAGLSVGQLVDSLLERFRYPLDRINLYSRLYRIEKGKKILYYKGPGDFDSDYLAWLMNTEGYNPCGIRPRLLQQKGRR